MTARTHQSTLSRSQYAAIGDDEHYTELDIMPGERIGAPLKRRRGRFILRGLAVIVLAFGGWAFVGGKDKLPPQFATVVPDNLIEKLPGWLSQLKTSIAAAINRNQRDTGTQSDAPFAAPPPPATTELDIKPAIAVASTAEIPPAATSPENEPHPTPPAALSDGPAPASSQPATGRNPGTSDPYRKRAEDVGLHPGLSPVLLARLTSTDYANARVAIAKALAETADDAALVWPPKLKSGVARFRIHFVPGASTNCRRYIVTVSKDGWLTTALPMVKCGIKRVVAKK